MRHSSEGFTLVELLVVITILGLLMALLLPAMQAAREAARRVQCSTKLKQIALALHNYHTTHQLLPPGAIVGNTACTADGTTRRQSPWTVQILPYMEQEVLYQQFNLAGRFFALANDGEPTDSEAAQKTPVTGFRCPSDPAVSWGEPSLNYLGVQGGGTEAQADCTTGPTVNRRLRFNNGVLCTNSCVQFGDIADGTSNTFLVAESHWWLYRHTDIGYPSWFSWASANRTAGVSSHVIVLVAAVDPINSPLVDYDASRPWVDSSGGYTNGMNLGTHTRCFGSYHPNGCHVAMADSSVRFLRDSTTLAVYRQMGQRADGLPLGGESN